MLIYKAMYKFLDNGVHAEVLDFPGVISWGPDLNEARQLLSSALADMAELNLARGEPLPQANAAATDPTPTWKNRSTSCCKLRHG